jgi:hypothetical protein
MENLFLDDVVLAVEGVGEVVLRPDMSLFVSIGCPGGLSRDGDVSG